MPRSARQQVVSKQREADCLTMRMEGLTFDQIATDLGFVNRSGAQKAFKRALERLGSEEAREALILQYERLNAMLAAIWPEVELGSLRAIQQALPILDRIDRLFGLDDPDCNCGGSSSKRGSSTGLPPGVIVIDRP